MLAVAESWENGKPVRETLAADIPLAADHFRYFAGVDPRRGGRDLRDRQGHRRLPLPRAARRRRADHPVQLPAADGGVEARPGARRRQLRRCSSRRARRRGRSSSSMELIEDIVPPGVINVVNGPGAEIGKALATNKRIAKIAFTGETVTGRLIMQYAAQNIIPSTTELGGKSPNIFFADVMAADDDVPRQGDRGPRALRLQQGRGLHVPVAGADPGVDLRRSSWSAAWSGSRRSGRATRSTRRRMIGAAGLDGAAREDRELRQDRPRGGRRAADRRRARRRSTASSRAATTSSRPSSRATTTCGSSRRRSSARCSP